MTKLTMLGPRIPTMDTRRAKPAQRVPDPIYSSAAHRRWRDEILRRAGGRCQDPACRTPDRATRIYADHIVELKDGGAFDLSNGLGRCGSCHTRKTLMARAARARRRPDL
jgi:hypothetical protein